MSELWDIVYVKIGSQEPILHHLKEIVASKGYRFLDWGHIETVRLRSLPNFHFWVSAPIRGWAVICRRFPPLAVTTKEISAALDCLTFQCWIGGEAWGYLLCNGSKVIDRFDSNPSEILYYKHDFSEWWDPDSPYAMLTSGKLSPNDVRELFGGHPERLTLLPLKKGTRPELLRKIMDSQDIFQTWIVERFAAYIDLPSFIPQLVTSEHICDGLSYLMYPTKRYKSTRWIAESIEGLENYTLLAFRPAPVEIYRRSLGEMPAEALKWTVAEAIGWYEWYLQSVPLDNCERTTAGEELAQLQDLWKEIPAADGTDK